MSFKELNINRRIRASYVRVIGKDGEQLGILDTRQAVQLADSMGLDLVEVAGQADPPVCKIMDYGKFKYEEKKKAQAARKKQVIVELKEVQIRPKTDEHDLAHKAKSTVGFIEDGNKAKVTVVFRGREMEHIDMGWETLKEFMEKLGDKAAIEVMPKMEGKRLSCILGPIPTGKKLPVGHLLASLPKAPPVRRGGQSYGGYGGNYRGNNHSNAQAQAAQAAAQAAPPPPPAAAAPAPAAAAPSTATPSTGSGSGAAGGTPSA